MDLRQLRYFVTIAEEQSLTAAAQRLHVTQPPLTAVVQSLEKELATTLLRRHARGVTLTDAGHHLLVRARRLLEDADQTRQEVRSLGSGSSGILSLAVVPSAGWRLTPALLRRFLLARPDVEVHVVETPGPVAAVEALRQRRVEASLLYTTDPVALCRDYADDLVAVALGTEPMMLLVPAGPGRGPLDIGDLEQTTWFTTRTSTHFPGLNAALWSAWRAAGIAPPVRRVSSMSVATMFVRAGLGLTPVAASLGDGGLSDDVALRATVPALPSLHGVLVRRREEASPTLARLLESASAPSVPVVR